MNHWTWIIRRMLTHERENKSKKGNAERLIPNAYGSSKRNAPRSCNIYVSDAEFTIVSFFYHISEL